VSGLFGKYPVNLGRNCLFFRSVIWYVTAKIREEGENCCDNLVMEMVGDKIRLAKTMTDVELFRQRESLVMAFGEISKYINAHLFINI
jgi:hypothetical protein